jgi:hypothetical protein
MHETPTLVYFGGPWENNLTLLQLELKLFSIANNTKLT